MQVLQRYPLEASCQIRARGLTAYGSRLRSLLVAVLCCPGCLRDRRESANALVGVCLVVILSLGPISHYWADDLKFLSVVVKKEFGFPEIAAFECQSGHSVRDPVSAVVAGFRPTETLSTSSQ